MHSRFKLVLFFPTLLAVGLIATAGLRAQESTYLLAHDDVFGRLRRTAVQFPHDQHEDVADSGVEGSAAATGCGVCHHARDVSSGRLIYQEGEEQSCAECHVSHRKDGIPGLRQAFHGNCTVCHRQQVRKRATAGGPTTCGGCHPKS